MVRGGKLRAGPERGLEESPPRRTARLPDHFAAAFEYADENKAGSSGTFSLIIPAPKSTSTSPQYASPRRSSRARQLRYADLQDAFAENSDEDEYQQKRASSSSPKKPKLRSNHLEDSDEQDTSSSSPSKKQRKRIRRTRDDPNSADGSIYAHLKGLPDLFAEHNDIMFCGINPGVKSSHSGHHFAHRSNHFYPSLHLAGITQQRMKPEQDVEFPYLQPLSLGLTNLAHRPTAEGNELMPSELIAGVPVLLEKIRKWKPKTVCFVGKGISEVFVKGLKQAGAIDNGKSRALASPKKKSRTSHSALKRSNSSSDLSSTIKAEEDESPQASSSFKVEDSANARRRLLTTSIPSNILCAHSAPASDELDTKSRSASPQKPPSSPDKAKKPLYTKGNSKDDSGYGILPLCVPHTKRHDEALSLDDVTLFFVTPSSSARVTTHFLDDKARILSSLRVLAVHLQDAAGRHQNGGVKLEEGSAFADTKLVDLEVIDMTRYDV